MIMLIEYVIEGGYSWYRPGVSQIMITSAEDSISNVMEG